MSRIGREPITVPAGVTVTVAEGNAVTVKGPKGELSRVFNAALEIKQEGEILTVCRPNDQKEMRSLHGLTRTLLNNMVEGVTKGFEKRLEIVGVGYRAEKQNGKIVLNLGYSHPVVFEEKNGITFEVPEVSTAVTKGAVAVIAVKGIDKQAVGQVAAVIRSARAPEPYKGKGIRYVGEKVRSKAGKSGK